MALRARPFGKCLDPRKKLPSLEQNKGEKRLGLETEVRQRYIVIIPIQNIEKYNEECPL